MDNNQSIEERLITPELYFLITKFLADGPLKAAAEVLVRELEAQKVLPKRTDWQGQEHDQTFRELEQKYGHISANHLMQICCRIGPILDKELAPSVPGIISLLGAGRQSLLRTKETINRPRSQLDYCTRIHGITLPDSSVTKPIHNFQKVLIGREYGGIVRRKLLVPTVFYGKTKLLRRTIGHLSSVYCVLFDRTGRYIITGADDLLIKIWSAVDGRLLATLRGASSEITDIAINLDNTMLAAGCLDRILRVWDLQTTSPIAVLSAHTGMITSVNFCPSPRNDLKYLVTTSTDGSIAFWQYSTPRGQKTVFESKPTQYHEKLRPGQAQMMCTTFSPGGMFLAAGSADHHVRVYMMEDGPKRILEVEAYTDAVDSVQWSHRDLRFISGSKDGTAHIWTFETQQWKSKKLCMTERLSSCPEPEEGKKLKVTMVAWDCSDKYVITAVNDFTIKIWNSKTAKLHCVLRGHKDELYVLESNPKDEHVLLSAGHDGQVFLWDIEQGISVAHFINDIDGQGHGGVFDAKWSPDGTMIAATDSHGHIIIFGLGYGPEKYQMLPTELFFHTDYRPLLRDAQHHVVDEQTQIMPHLMPPPFLVDADGNPHPARYQRFVPGRENCTNDQLIPNLTVDAEGIIIDDSGVAPGVAGLMGVVQPHLVPALGPVNANSPANNFSQIDRLIAALANRQGSVQPTGAAAPAANNASRLDRMIGALAHRQEPAPDSNNLQPGGNVLGNGREVAAVRPAPIDVPQPAVPRQGTTWGRPPATSPVVPNMSAKYTRRIFVRPMKYQQLLNLRMKVYDAGKYEMQEYKREMRKRPIMINTSIAMNLAVQTGQAGRHQRSTRSTNAGRLQRRRTQARNTNVRPRPLGAQQQQPQVVGQNQGEGQRTGQAQQGAYRTRGTRELNNIAEDEEFMGSRNVARALEEDDDESDNTSGDTSYSNVEANLDESSDDSDSDSSDYSDWVADKPGPNLEPPKRCKHKPLTRHRASSDGNSSDETNEQASSLNANKRKPNKRPRHIVIPPPLANGEIPEIYRPAEWLSEVIPRKAPYYPQMGDEVVYFRQGHQRYIEAARTKKVYKLTHSAEPWNFHTLRDREFVRVIGIKYEIRPPRLCCLKLALLDEEGNMTGTSFKIKYHDMPDVLDFLVLRQTYDLAMQRNWSIGDRFRCMIGDGWWMGQIESRHALSAEFPDSYFMCFHVRWDNAEYEYMSPWDMEPIDEARVPDDIGGRVAVLPEEIRATLYQPKSEEWHRGDRDGSCRRIINGLEQVMRLSIAEHFLAPVDLNIYPDYAYLIEYPIDLTTIKSRFENHFYRRITSAQFDVRYLATNAEKYNRSHTNIVKHARIITDLCLRVIREQNDIDVAAVYHQLVDVYHSSETENDNDSDVVPSTSTGPSTSTAARKNQHTTRKSNRVRGEIDWRSECRQLLDVMWARPDSGPFREPVDTIDFPDYLEIIATPMDLRTVKEDLLGGNYEDPLDFAKDVRLIFQNSKNYNTNKRSRENNKSIYSMTLRLSAFFESHIKTVISNWKAALRRVGKGSVSPSKRNKQPSRRLATKNARRMLLTDDEDDDDDEIVNHQLHNRNTHNNEDDDDDDDLSNPRPSGSQAARRNMNGGRSHNVGSSSGSNRVTSSSSAQQQQQQLRRRGGNDDDDDDDDDDDEETALSAIRARRSKRNAHSQEVEENGRPTRGRQHDHDNDDEDEELNIDDDDEEEDTGTSSDSSSSDDDDDDEDEDEDEEDALASARKKRKSRRNAADDEDYGVEDSEDSYKPKRQPRVTNKTKKHRKSSKKNKKSKKRINFGRPLNEDEDDDGDDDDNDEDYVERGTKRRTPAKRASNGVGSLSQVDESTQEANTPRKRGRPAKPNSTSKSNMAASSSSNVFDDGPSTSASAIKRLREGQGRPRRHPTVGKSPRAVANGGPTVGVVTDANAAGNLENNDHSYHLPVRNGRLAETDSDSREALVRPTRASVKRAILDWARSSDVEAAEDEIGSDTDQVLPTSIGSKTNGTTNHQPGTTRQLRTNRNTAANIEENEDSYDGSDYEPLAQQRIQNNNPPSNTRSTMQQKRIATRVVSSTHMTRSHAATSSTSVVTVTQSGTSRASSVASASAPHAAHDHNYLGDRASSSSATRPRVLSRHQRNADELDESTDPLESSMLISRLRRMPSSTSNEPEQTQRPTGVRRGRSRYSQENSQSAVEEPEAATPADEIHTDDSTNGGSLNSPTSATSVEDDDDDDSDDNQPLTAMVPTRVAALTRQNQDSRRNNVRRTTMRPNSFSFEEDNHNGDGDDDNYGSRRHERRKRTARTSTSSAQKSSRQKRHQKRPRYNEQSDDTDEYLAVSKRRREENGGTALNANNRVGSSSSTTQNGAGVNLNTNNDTNHDESDVNSSDDENLVSVSSRGRVRKLTAKARGIRTSNW